MSQTITTIARRQGRIVRLDRLAEGHAESREARVTHRSREVAALRESNARHGGASRCDRRYDLNAWTSRTATAAPCAAHGDPRGGSRRGSRPGRDGGCSNVLATARDGGADAAPTRSSSRMATIPARSSRPAALSGRRRAFVTRVADRSTQRSAMLGAAVCRRGGDGPARRDRGGVPVDYVASLRVRPRSHGAARVRAVPTASCSPARWTPTRNAPSRALSSASSRSPNLTGRPARDVVLSATAPTRRMESP